MRSDARRNYERILAAASAEVAVTGADASLEKIARDAGVGSATLHRHFPTRQALLEAVFHDRVEVLCAQAAELSLADWLRAVAEYGATTRGLAASLLAPPAPSGCETMLSDAGGALLRRAQQAGEIRADVAIIDLLTLVNAVSLATQDGPEAIRLTTLALNGIRP
ncbi:TetR/AcrR family transcriptional regulator [Actinoplanes couchii]|uniref:TetR family transcriptional regulator n=1 Tax=Actinoplanes couchii TaxID=403638 RepID=A0ABQ3XLZ1_9ACTN|nr:TetR/AcrR family transcriptional regulator [Actinoplanes couchii]MDR6319262.1 AcrR family transcriptional regulator [Actinoplanes couchii]GID59529.1 TetR family transcriptional regulator [Actinoplanes couchii]